MGMKHPNAAPKECKDNVRQQQTKAPAAVGARSKFREGVGSTQQQGQSMLACNSGGGRRWNLPFHGFGLKDSEEPYKSMGMTPFSEMSISVFNTGIESIK